MASFTWKPYQILQETSSLIFQKKLHWKTSIKLNYLLSFSREKKNLILETKLAKLVSQIDQNMQVCRNCEAYASGKGTTRNSFPCPLHIANKQSISAFQKTKKEKKLRQVFKYATETTQWTSIKLRKWEVSVLLQIALGSPRVF